MKPPKRPLTAFAFGITPFALCLAVSALAILVFALSGCMFGGDNVAGAGGGGTETESNVVAGLALNEDGSPAVYAHVSLAPSDYLEDVVSTGEVSPRRKDVETDAQGSFSLGRLPTGSYRVEIAGTEAGGSIHDFSVAEDNQGIRLASDTLRLRGSIRGTFAPDSETQLTRFVQVFGMERLVPADGDGGFVLPNLPAGVYDIRCSSLQPFRRDAVRMGIVVHAGEQTVIPAVTLEKEAKLTFSVDGVGLKIDGLDTSNPVILDNERWDNGVESEYIWVKASLGTLDLRGNIVTVDLKTGQTIPAQIAAGRETLRLAKLAGLKGIPDLVEGATARVSMAASGRIEDIRPVPSAGSDLIVAEARKATPEKPLLVLAGGPLTTVAQAYLTDPSIASRMVVAGVYTYRIQSMDTTANYLVAKKCRFLQWGRTYTWGGIPDTTGNKGIPLSALGDKVRAYVSGGQTHISYGDLAPIAYLYKRSLWKTALMVKVSASMEVQSASDITFDFLDIPEAANDWQGYIGEFYSTMDNIDAYTPKPVPGGIPAEGYIGRIGVSAIPFDSAAASTGVAFPAGAWTDYRVSAAAAGKFSVVLHYRSGAGGRMSIGLAGAAVPLAEANLAAAVPWSQASLDSIPLAAGVSVLRVTSTLGEIDLTGLDLK